MTTVETVVQRARSMVVGSLGHPVTLLTSAWNGGSSITFSPDRKLAQGQQLSAGLTTFTVLEASSGSATVIAGLDGSPTTQILSGTPLHIRPLHTTWQVFQGVQDTVEELSSPSLGLFRVAEETHPIDHVWGTYTLTQSPLKILRVRNLAVGSSDRWVDVPFTFQPSGPTVTVSCDLDPTSVHIQYALPFGRPTSLADTLSSLGFTDSHVTLLATGAARPLALATESRRAQPYSQGDPRRAEEVPVSASAMVYDRLQARFRDLVAAERARIVQQYPYKTMP